MHKEEQILLSGIQPSGKPHIGNYFGAMKQFVDLQDKFQNFIFIADYHALTTLQNPKELEANVADLILDYLAIGLDPKRVVLYKQSDIPEVTELAWIFECITTVPYLSRAHAFKDAESKKREVNVGTFNYPLLMAADILIQDADIVPVGADQRQHLEIAVDTAEKFNRIFGETFNIPRAHILEQVETVVGTDGQKMSKSYKNTIDLFASDDEIRAAVMKIPTDSKAVDDPKDPEADNTFALHKLFTSGPEFGELRDRYEAGGIGYKESKEILIKNIINFVLPLRSKRVEWEGKVSEALEIIEAGSKKARARAMEKMELVRSRVGVKAKDD